MKKQSACKQIPQPKNKINKSTNENKEKGKETKRKEKKKRKEKNVFSNSKLQKKRSEDVQKGKE